MREERIVGGLRVVRRLWMMAWPWDCLVWERDWEWRIRLWRKVEEEEEEEEGVLAIPFQIGTSKKFKFLKGRYSQMG